MITNIGNIGLEPIVIDTTTSITIGIDDTKESLLNKLQSFDPYVKKYFKITRDILPPYPQEKQFVCKGLHKYERSVVDKQVVWACQCGRKTTD